MLYFGVIKMKKQCLVLALLSLISLSSFAVIPNGDDTTNRPNDYFLTNPKSRIISTQNNSTKQI